MGPPLQISGHMDSSKIPHIGNSTAFCWSDFEFLQNQIQKPTLNMQKHLQSQDDWGELLSCLIKVYMTSKVNSLGSYIS